ncbi:MAG: preprotein translocase subunit SecA [Patescibacteria group bacterium]|nr:preprotein translocase subunit SecA [Patescibacteria group bacterium]
MSLLSKIFGDPNQRYLKKLQPILEKINSLEKELAKIPTEKIKEKTFEFKERLKKGETLDDLLPEAFALVREAAKRTIKMRHFDVQILGGIVLHRGQVAEMKTGEGKTLVATLPLYLNALEGKGCHLVTVNDYLARRDVEWMGPIYHCLGLSVGVLNHEKAYLYQPKEDGRTTNLGSGEELLEVPRQQAYQADLTYGTNHEFGFDYLRDNMVYDLADTVQRELNYAIIDEIDSILIDEARTPLIISSPAKESADLYYQLARLVEPLKENEDYNLDRKMRTVALTEKGQKKIIKSLGFDPWQMAGSSNPEEVRKGLELDHHITAALRAKALFKRDRDYVVKDGEIVIVDEFTGRLMFGRRYSEGLHQAIEAREHEIGRQTEVEVKKESKTLATITFQNYFRLYKKLAGMTGTAITEAEEFYKIYNLEVVVIPPNRPLIRVELPDRIYATEEAKFKAVVQEIKERYQRGQPVLVGTTSIEKNELLSDLLKREGIPHQVLNAKHHEKEAQIIAQAGKLKAVTVATNMAGRGVDIILGGNPPDLEEQKRVIALGGLHVIGTERHEARRIDNQLRGRAGRQGDPGSSQFFVSAEDDLMKIFGGERIKALMQTFNFPPDLPIENRLLSRSIEQAQKRVEGYNFDLRKHLLDYDDVLNKHREAIYRLRREILQEPEKTKARIFEMIKEEIEKIIAFHTSHDLEKKWDLREIGEVVSTIFPLPSDFKESFEKIRSQAGTREKDVKARELLFDYLFHLAQKNYEELEKRIGGEKLMRQIEKMIFLRSIDTCWIFHLETMENLKGGIGLRAYGQRDPLVEYKKEAYYKFHELLEAIRKQVVYSIFKISIERQSPSSQFQQPAIESRKKTGRNDPCPCGSGRKYKKCCYPKYG